MNKFTKIIMAGALTLIMGLTLTAQTGSVAFVDQLSRKETATAGDAVKFFVLMKGKSSAGFQADIDFLRKEGILDSREYSENDPLKRGDAAFMTARLLKLEGSLMYNIFKNRRYAVTACRAAGIIQAPGGENYIVSGGELIDIMNNLSAVMGGQE